MPDEKPTIRSNIRRLRFEPGEDVAGGLGETDRRHAAHTIMAPEAGKYFPSLLLAFCIARAFGARVEQDFEYAKAGDR